MKHAEVEKELLTPSDVSVIIHNWASQKTYPKAVR